MLLSHQDVADLAGECQDEELQESKGSVRLGRRVEAMINQVDVALQRLEASSDSVLRRLQEERLGEVACDVRMYITSSHWKRVFSSDLANPISTTVVITYRYRLTLKVYALADLYSIQLL